MRYHQQGLNLRVDLQPDDYSPPIPGFIEPAKPDAALIELIHRRHDGYVSIHRKDENNELRNVCSIPARCLPGLFDQMVDLLDAESFFSINGMWRGAHWTNNHDLKDTEGKLLPGAHRNKKDTRWLTSCYSDIDCKKLGVSIGQAFGAVINAQDKGLLPPASIITRSGNGLWLFWLVSGADCKTPSECSPAFDNHVDKWAAIQGAILNRLGKLGADANALDVPRVTRIPGSVNAKAKLRVSYWVQYDQEGNVPKFTLSELAEWFGVVTKVTPRLVQHVTTIYQQRASKGQAGRWLKAKQNFNRLWARRGQFKVGTRNAAVLVYATILRCLPGKHRLTDAEILEALEELYKDLEQVPGDRYTHQQMLDTFAATKPTRLAPIRNQTISDMLEITPDESELLPTWKAASRFVKSHDEQPPTLNRQETRDRRRRLISQIVERNNGIVPPSRELAALIENAGLDCPSPTTVLKDLEALGLSKPKKSATDTSQKPLF